MEFPKFIIENDNLIIAICTYHKQLAFNVDNIKGGGLWTLDRENQTYTLYGESYDFGPAKIEDITECVKNGKVFSSKALYKNLSNFKFRYKDQSGDVFDL